MTDFSPLVVPVEVEALVVNDAVRARAFQRWSFNYRALGLFGSAEPPPFGSVDTSFDEPGGTIIEGSVTAAEYYNGVYLKWRLPDALRRGVQDSAAAVTTFPRVPNRWLVVRDGVSAWLVESDYSRPPATPTSYTDSGSDFIDASGHPLTIGRAIPLTSAGWTEPGTPTYLTAVAPGNLAFSAYQPACNNVFSFVDQLTGATAGPYDYLVLGWHSAAADDPLYGVTAETFAQAMDALGWALPDGTDPGATASSVVYCGTVTGVADPSTVTAGGAPAADEVSVAIGGSTARALATLVAQQAEADHAAVDSELLEALVLDLVRVYDQTDGPAAVDAAAFAAGFRATTGGSSWTLVPADGGGGTPPPPLTPQQLAELAKLNQAQVAADLAARTLADLRRRLYELWFKYELLPDPATTLTQRQLKPNLLPTHAEGLAGEVVAAEETVTSTAATVATMTAVGTAPSGYAYKQVNRPSFFQPADPVVLLSRAGAAAIVGSGATLTCRLATQLVSGYKEQGGGTVTSSSPGVSIPTPVTGSLTGVPWTPSLLTAIVTENYFLDDLPAGATPIGTVPTSGRAAWTAQPWHPLYLLWEAEYYPIAHDSGNIDNWTFQDGSYAWNGAGGAEPDAGFRLQGRNLLTPQASLTVGARLQALLDTAPDLTTAERIALEQLQTYVESKDEWDLLSQALDGFGDQLLQRTTGAFPSPVSATLQTTPSIASMIDGGAGNPPLPGAASFQPWRSGQFEFLALAVVDEWGQALFVADHSDFQQLVLHRPDEMQPDPKSVLPGPDPVVQLSPALLQPGRLNFDMVSASDDTQVLGIDPGVNPICGWVLPNHLDQALMAFDASGSALGELGIGIGANQLPVVVWRPAPATQYPTWQSIAAIPHFGPFLQRLYSGSAADLTAVMAAIDETLWTTAPIGTQLDRNLATLAGRPLALVRARLAFELEGPPVGDPSWQYTLAPSPTPAPAWHYAIELGNLEQLSDGLIGYFAGDDYDAFYIVSQSGATDGDYLHLIGADGGLVELTFDGTTTQYISMLVDPRAAVHATTSVLPVTSVTLPPSLVTSALSDIDLSFRVGPILTELEPTQTGSALLIPQPAGAETWSWIDAGASAGELTAIAPPSTAARLRNTPPVLRSGRLDLRSAFAPHNQPPKGSRP